MREEIVGGLRNAIERGSSLDIAVQSFLNAGYNPVEVREAAMTLHTGALTSVAAPLPVPVPKSTLPSAVQNPAQLSVPQAEKKGFLSQWTTKQKIIAIVLVALGFVGGLIALLFLL